MAPPRLDRSTRIFTTALTRRRALRNLSGAAALALAGRRAGAARSATVSLPLGYYPGLARAALVPADLPGGDGFGVAAGYSFLGPSGATGRQGLDEAMLAALGDTVEAVIGGHLAIISPLNPPLNRNVSTRLVQFASLAAARDAFAKLAADGFPALEDVTPADGRDRFFQGTLQQGSTTYAQELALFRTAEIVGIILISDATGAAAPEPLPGPPVERLAALRQLVASRLRDVADLERAGLRRAIPSVPEFAAASNGQLDLSIDSWLETYTKLDGQPIRSRYQSDEAFQAFGDNHPGLLEALQLINHLTTFGGHPLTVQVSGFRFDGATQATATNANAKAVGLARTGDLGTDARAFYDRIEERAQESAAANPGLAISSVQRPPEAPETVEAKWLLSSQTTQTSRSVTAVGWTIDGTDVVGVSIPGPPRPPDEDDDPDQIATLFRFASLAIAGGALWRETPTSATEVLGDLEAVYDGFGDFPDWCSDYDDQYPDD